MSSKGERLAKAVRDRRSELDLTQLDVWQAGGPSNTTLTRVESGELDTLSRVTARKLDKGLRWAPGSARAIYDQGEPPAPATEHGLEYPDARWLAEQIATLDEDRRRRIISIIEEKGPGA